MFYSHLVLTKKGPLAKVWVAATLGESKVPKSYALNCRIHVLCDSIEKPAAPFALRLSASLLLGVVRVFSRKAQFVFKDVQAIIYALQRLDVHTHSKSSGRKRARDAAPSFSTRGASSMPISLEDGQDLARLDMITLPLSKKRRTRTYALPALAAGHFSTSAEFGRDREREQSVASFGDISISHAPELDVLEAMETLFPSVVVPRFGQHQRGSSGTPSSDIASRDRTGLLHRAREEDITLAPSASHFGNLRQELFLEDLPVSLESQQPSLLIQPEPTASIEEDHGEIRAFGVGSGVPSSAAGDTNVPEDTLPPQQDLFTGGEPEDIEPLQISPFALRSTSSEHSDRRKSVDQTAAKVSVKSTKTSPDDTSSKKNLVSASSAPLSTRTKKFPRIRLDDVTELSPEQIRASLQDTSDIVLADGEERRSRRRGKRSGAAIKLSNVPISFFSFPESIVGMWNELTEDLAEGSERVPHGSQAHSPELQLSISDERSPLLEEGGSVSPGQQQGAPLPLQGERPGVTMVEDEAMLVPELQPLQTTPRQGSVEVLRESVVRRETPAVLSHHSRSMGTSGSRSFPSGSGSLRSRAARLRDHIFEMITEADERSFRHAREQSSDRRRSGALGRRVDTINEEDVGSSGAPQRDEDAGRLELRASDFQLMEETEKDDEQSEQDRAPFESIGIHAYKMLELLRSEEESRQLASNVETEREITSFGALVKDCSRGVTARAFFNVLSLASSGFVSVSQERPYAPILLKPGSFFRSQQKLNV